MWPYLNHPLAVLFARVALGLILLIASLTKLLNRKEVIQAVADYKILPHFLTRPFGILLPWMELGTAILLLSGMIPTVAGLLAAILFICFITAILINLLRGRDLNCHCFGQLYQEKVGGRILFQDLILLSFALEILSFHIGFFPTKDSAIKPPLPENLLTIILGVGFVIVFALFQQMHELFQQTTHAPRWVETHQKQRDIS